MDAELALRPAGRSALRNQMIVLAALILREAEMKNGRAFAFGFVLAMFEPLVIIGAICLLFHLIDRAPIYGSSMVLFVATGVFPVYLFIYTSGRVHEPLQTAHIGCYPVERPLDGVVAHATLHAVSSSVVAVLFFVVLHACGIDDALPYDYGRAVGALATIYGFGVGMGLVNTVVGRILPVWGSVWPALSRASVHFAGIYYVVDFFPPHIRAYFAANPMLHAVEWFRTAFYPFYPTVTVNPDYLIAGMLISLFVGLCLERACRPLLLKGA
jgi:capsular polysaccharide transport system permease protein